MNLQSDDVRNTWVERFGELPITADSPKCVFDVIRKVKLCDYQETLTLQI